MDRERAGCDRPERAAADFCSIRVPGRPPVDAGGRPAQRLADGLPRPWHLHGPDRRRDRRPDVPRQHDVSAFRESGRRHVLLLRQRDRSRGRHRERARPDRHDRHDSAQRDRRGLRPGSRRRRARNRPRLGHECRRRLRRRVERPARRPCRGLRHGHHRQLVLEHHALHRRLLRRLQRRDRQGRTQHDRGAQGDGHQRRRNPPAGAGAGRGRGARIADPAGERAAPGGEPSSGGPERAEFSIEAGHPPDALEAGQDSSRSRCAG